MPTLLGEEFMRYRDSLSPDAPVVIYKKWLTGQVLAHRLFIQKIEKLCHARIERLGEGPERDAYVEIIRFIAEEKPSQGPKKIIQLHGKSYHEPYKWDQITEYLEKAKRTSGGNNKLFTPIKGRKKK
jgi:hypothetical protein